MILHFSFLFVIVSFAVAIYVLTSGIFGQYEQYLNDQSDANFWIFLLILNMLVSLFFGWLFFTSLYIYALVKGLSLKFVWEKKFLVERKNKMRFVSMLFLLITMLGIGIFSENKNVILTAILFMLTFASIIVASYNIFISVLQKKSIFILFLDITLFVLSFLSLSLLGLRSQI